MSYGEKVREFYSKPLNKQLSHLLHQIKPHKRVYIPMGAGWAETSHRSPSTFYFIEAQYLDYRLYYGASRTAPSLVAQAPSWKKLKKDVIEVLKEQKAIMESAMRKLQARVQIQPEDSVHTRVAKRVLASQYNLNTAARSKQAGEIRFIKDQGPEQREIPDNFEFDPKYVKPLANVLWSLSCSMGHLVSAQSSFTKIKAVKVSPDGKLGGKGYIQAIRDMRTSLSEAIETISNNIDTIHDEINGDHWKTPTKSLSKKDKAEVDEMVSDAEEILEDPEAYDQQKYQEEVLDDIE